MQNSFLKIGLDNTMTIWDKFQNEHDTENTWFFFDSFSDHDCENVLTKK